jgi:hypothetical protein
MTNEINFDIKRMEKAISGESILIPSSLTPEEMRWYICATARKEIEIPDEIKNDDALLGEYVKVCYSVMRVSEEKSKAIAKRGRDKIVEANLENTEMTDDEIVDRVKNLFDFGDISPEEWGEVVAWARKYIKPLD